jgi:hypothetical protein
MRHVRIAAKDLGKVTGHYVRIRRYRDFATFRNDYQNHAPNDIFWTQATAYTLNDMNKYFGTMSRKYTQKQAEDVQSEVEVGLLLGNKCVVSIKPGNPKSATHLYVFFPSADEEVEAELSQTFGV